MQTIFLYLLLSLSLIGIAYLVARDVSLRQNSSNRWEMENRLLEQNKKLLKEITALKKQVEQSDQRLELMIKLVQTIPTAPAANKQVTQINQSEHLLLNDRYKEIFDLKERGLSAEQIARELQKGYGEVAFILALANKRE